MAAKKKVSKKMAATKTAAADPESQVPESQEESTPAIEATEDGPGLVGADLDNVDASALYPDRSRPPADFKTDFPDLGREDYSSAAKELRAEAAEKLAEAEKMEADYRVRFPAHVELPVADQNAINHAHGKERRKRLRAQRARDLDALRKTGFSAKDVSALIGGSKLDNVLNKRGKDPSLVRKPPRRLQGG